MVRSARNIRDGAKICGDWKLAKKELQDLYDGLRYYKQQVRLRTVMEEGVGEWRQWYYYFDNPIAKRSKQVPKPSSQELLKLIEEREEQAQSPKASPRQESLFEKYRKAHARSQEEQKKPAPSSKPYIPPRDSSGFTA